MRYLIPLTLFFSIGIATAVGVIGDEPAPSNPAPLRPAPEPAKSIPSIREIMQQAHRCRNNYIGQISSGLNNPLVPWSDLELRSRDLIQMGKYLQMNTPKRNAGEAWERMTSVYIAHATLLSDAIDQRDFARAQEHTKDLKHLCQRCHSAHR